MVKRFENLVRKGDYLIPESRLNKKGGYRYSDKTYYGSNDFNKLSIIMEQKHSNLRVFVYNDIKDSQSGYKYLITSYGATSHSAFRTEAGFERFMKMTGLKRNLVNKTTQGKVYELIGSYSRIYMSGNYKLLNEFGKKNKLTRTKIIDNGDYTTGYYDGKGKIYLLNPNYPRTIYNHFWE